jgi:hypothetical protein
MKNTMKPKNRVKNTIAPTRRTKFIVAPYATLTQNMSQACHALRPGPNNNIALYTTLNQNSLVPKPLMQPPIPEPSYIHIKG